MEMFFRNLSQSLSILLICGHAVAGTIPTFATSNLVLGRPNKIWYATLQYPVDSRMMDTPTCVAVDPVTRKVFVGEKSTHRILRFASATSLSDGAAAEAVFGQPRFTSSAAGSGDYGLGEVNGLFVDALGRLWVADTTNNRVLAFESASFRGDQPYADYVIGQPDFTTRNPGAAVNKMNGPTGVFVDSNSRLWVADTNNNRVLRFDYVYPTLSNGLNAAAVLGQSDFASSAPGTGSAGIQGPIGIAVTPGGSLFVACYNGNRVLRFDKAATLSNGSGASGVLGQPDFAPLSANLNASAFSHPSGVALDSSGRLWVTDCGNRRVLRFDQATSKPNGAAADGVVGQSRFTTGDWNGRETGFFDLFGQSALDIDGNLWVPDQGLHRVLRFVPDATLPIVKVTGRITSNSGATVTVKGTSADASRILKVMYQVNGGPLLKAIGGTSWRLTTDLKIGANVITVYAVDWADNKSLVQTVKITRKKSVSPFSLAIGG